MITSLTRLISVLVTILILVVIPFGTIAQPMKSITYDKITLNAERLPKKYIGSNTDIVKILNNHNIKKNEFETTATYETRNKYLDNKIYAFSYKPCRFDCSNGVTENEFAYNLDEESFQIKLTRIKVIEKSWDVLKGSYAGHNVFGTKVNIYKGIRNRYFIHLPNENYNYKFKMQPDKAKLVADNIRMLFWVKLTDAKCSKSNIIPTIHNPFDGTYIGCECRTIPIEMWLYDYNTGKIYEKYKNYIETPIPQWLEM